MLRLRRSPFENRPEPASEVTLDLSLKSGLTRDEHVVPLEVLAHPRLHAYLLQVLDTEVGPENLFSEQTLREVRASRAGKVAASRSGLSCSHQPFRPSALGPGRPSRSPCMRNSTRTRRRPCSLAGAWRAADAAPASARVSGPPPDREGPCVPPHRGTPLAAVCPRSLGHSATAAQETPPAVEHFGLRVPHRRSVRPTRWRAKGHPQSASAPLQPLPRAELQGPTAEDRAYPFCR